MKPLLALSLATGLLCGLWTLCSELVGLTAWIGFAGCTTYFASGKKGLTGLTTTIRQNMLGVLAGIAIITLGDLLPFTGSLGFYSGVITFIMCIAGKYGYFSFIPGTFVGCFSTFAAQGNYLILILSLLCGALLGIACDTGGNILLKCSKKQK